MSKRPNILFIMSDEHRADVTGYGGNNVIRTPIMDELAATGTSFSNAYTPSPVCVPARQCVMSGQLPKTCGCEGWVDLQPNYMTIPKRFAQYGYSTVAAGKLHHQGPDQAQGWITRIGTHSINEQHIDGRVIEEYEKIRVEKRDKEDYRNRKWSDAKEVRRAGIGKSPCETHDRYAVEGAVNYLREYFLDSYYDKEKSHRPLLLYVGYLNPHYPYFADEEKFEYYLNRVEPFLNQTHSDHEFLSHSPFPWQKITTGPEGDLSERDVRRATAAYYANIEANEELTGAVLETINDVGQDIDDWIIVSTSDHGEMLGEHGVWEKQKFYEGSARVPLIIRYPEKLGSGTVVDQNVNLCDLFATLCELADIPAPEGLDSRSLVPLANEDFSNWNNETVSVFLQQGFKNVMIKQDHLKYGYYSPDLPEVLFDLNKNPEETVNFIDDPAYTDAVKKFHGRLAELGYGPNADANYVNAGY